MIYGNYSNPFIFIPNHYLLDLRFVVFCLTAFDILKTCDLLTISAVNSRFNASKSTALNAPDLSNSSAFYDFIGLSVILNFCLVQILYQLNFLKQKNEHLLQYGTVSFSENTAHILKKLK